MLNRYAQSTVEQKQSLNESTKKWRLANPDKIKEIRKRTDSKRKIIRREKELQKNFGITSDQYLKMAAEQGDVCAICLTPETLLGKGGEIRPLCVDHCHTTGQVRGLLCANCNLALGHFKDQQERLRSAMEYLNKYEKLL